MMLMFGSGRSGFALDFHFWGGKGKESINFEEELSYFF
jgi:hypothetical protein